jgi:hypothetical protein
MTPRVRALATALTVAALAAPVGAAGQSRPGAPPDGASPSSQARAVTPGIVRGRVTSGETARPLRRVEIMLTTTVRTSGVPPVYAYTDNLGRWEAKDVPPGTYLARAVRAGYVSLQFGQRRPRDQGTSVEVRPGETVERIDIALPRGGVLAGSVVDELGEPYPGVRVDALALRYQYGRRVPFPVGVATTDDLGWFRIPNLEPGTYYLSATSTETWQTPKKETLGYATTYYPSGPAERAQRITLETSEVKTGLNITLLAGRAARVSGRVVRETGEPMPATGVMMAYHYPGGTMTAGMRTVRSEADGSFQFKDVAGGDYELAAAGAYQPVTVTGADVENVLLVSRSGTTVHGTLTTDEGTPPPFPTSGVRVLLETSSEDVLPTGRVVSVDADWSFKLTNLGGPFLFRLMGLPDGWMLNSVTLNDKDITDVPWDVPTGGRDLTGLAMTVTQKVGSVSGSVQDADGKPSPSGVVIVFAEDGDLWGTGSRFVQATRPGSDGRFTVKGLPGGSYRAFVRAFIEDGQWEDREFLEQARAETVAFTLADGGSHAVTLKLPR